MRAFQSPEGEMWNVDVRLPSHSGAMVIFQHAGGQDVAGDRYAWINAHATGANDPRERLSAKFLLDALNDGEIGRLFRRSMAVRKS
jgi:hypothetical protein